MKRIALTGGIASGKSTVSKYIQSKGIPVIDADQVARDAVAPGMPAYQEIVQTFGPDILLNDKQIDRKKLGSIVFSSQEKLQQLNQITHPRVAQLAAERFVALEEQGHSFVVYEVPLLFENQLQDQFDTTILVSIPLAVQVKRLTQRDPITEEEALARINSQLPLEEKAKLADYIIDNAGTQEQTIEQIERIWSSVFPSHTPPT